MKQLMMISAILLYGCGTGSTMWTNVDTWFREAPMISGSAWEIIPRDDVHGVLPDKLDAAVSLLTSQSAALVDLQDAERLSGMALKPATYYLVRGLCLACGGTGSFLVYRNGAIIAVFHHSLASRALPMTRWPVIVSLDAPPSDVYVEATSDS